MMTAGRMGVVGLGLLLAACNAGAESGTSESDVVAEEVKAIEGHLASCAVAGSNIVTVSCTDLSAALPTKFLLDVSVTGADGSTKSFNLWDRSEGSLQMFPSFPITIEIKAHRKADAHDAQALISPELRQKLTVAANTTAPLDVRLPYDFWPVTVSTSALGLMKSEARPLSIAPWTVDGGASSAQIAELQEAVRADAPARAILVAPVGAKSIPVTFTLGGQSVQGTFDGPGAFVVGANGLARVGSAPAPSSGAEPTSFGDVAETFLACHAGTTSVDGQRVSCSLRETAGTKISFLDVTLKDATGRGLGTKTLSAGDTAVGHCVGGPCTVEGAVQLDVDGRTIDGKLALPLGSAPSTIRLPYERFTVSVDASGIDAAKAKVVDVRLGADATLPASGGWTTALDLRPFALRAPATEATFAVPVGTRSVPVHVIGLDLVAKKKVEAVGTVEAGKRYAVTSAMQLVAVP